MKKKSFEEIIGKIEVPYDKSHKKQLKQNLMAKAKQLYPKKKTDSAHQNSNFWNSFFFRKGFALLTLIIFVFTLVLAKNQFVKTDIVNAQAIVDQAIKNLSELNFDQKNMSADLRMTLDVLQKALDENNLRYVGEDDLGDRKSYKLAFTDDNLGSSILVVLNPQNNYSPEYQDSYSRNAVGLAFASQADWEGITKNIQIETREIDQEKLISNLQDPNLKNALLKALIEKQNANFIFGIKQQIKDHGEWCDEPMGGTPNPDAALPSHLSDQELASLIEPLVQNSGVLFDSVLCQRDQKRKIKSFDLGFHVVSELKKNRDEAFDLLNQADQALSKYETPEAKIKRKLIQKIKTSTLIARVNRVFYEESQKDTKGNFQMNSKSLPAVLANDCIGIGSLSPSGTDCPEIVALIDSSKQSEKMVEFEFNLSQGGENAAFTKVTGNFKDGKITNAENLLKMLKNPQNGDGKYLVQYRNLQVLQALKTNYIQYNQKDLAITTLINKFEPIFRDSNMIIWGIDWKKDEKSQMVNILALPTESNIETFTISVLPIENLLFPSDNKNEETQKANELIQQTIITLQPNSQELLQKLAVLKEARQAKDLKYVGEEKLKNDKKVQAFSFTDPQTQTTIFIYIDPSDPTSNGIMLPVVKTANAVYQDGTKVQGADGSSVQVLSYSFFKDNNAVYYGNTKVEGANPQSFEVLQEPFAKDRNFIYFQSKKLDGADHKTFEVLNDVKVHSKETYFGKDKNAIYSDISGEKLKGIDPTSFQILEGYYYKDKNGVYMLDNAQKISGADPQTFEILNYPYFKDKNSVYVLSQVYYGLEKVPEADTKSFQALSGNYARDKNKIYFWGQALKDVDISSFQVLKSGYSKDKNHVYLSGEIAPGVDQKSFQILNEMYSKDKTSIYYLGSNPDDNKIKETDPESFAVFPSDTEEKNLDFAKDKKHVYWAGRIILGADPATFQLFGGFYGKDHSAIYKLNEVMTKADYSSFKFVGDVYAKDKNTVYKNGEEISGVDPATFLPIAPFNGYFLDKNGVYFEDKIIEGADAKTFVVLEGSLYAHDKNATYYAGERLK